MEFRVWGWIFKNLIFFNKNLQNYFSKKFPFQENELTQCLSNVHNRALFSLCFIFCLFIKHTKNETHKQHRFAKSLLKKIYSWVLSFSARNDIDEAEANTVDGSKYRINSVDNFNGQLRAFFWKTISQPQTQSCQ